MPFLRLAPLALLLLTACPPEPPGVEDGGGVLEDGGSSVGEDGGNSGRNCVDGEAQCVPGEVCNWNTGFCEERPACIRPDELVCTAQLSWCNPQSPLECSSCVSDSTCGGDYPRCNAGNCVQCIQDEDCGGATPFCFAGRCASCNGASCGEGQACLGGVCRDACSVGFACQPGLKCEYPLGGREYCVACEAHAECEGTLSCLEGVCGQAQLGDTCKTPIPLAVAPGTLLVDGAVTALFGTDDPKDVVDAYYTFEVAEAGLFTVSIGGAGALTPSAILQLRTGASCGGTMLAQHDWKGSLEEVPLTPGSYSLRIAFRHGTYPYRLRMTFTPQPLAEGNSCTGPIPINLGAAGGSEATLRIDPTGMGSIGGDACDTEGTLPDVVVSFTLEEPSSVQGTATPVDPAGGVSAYLTDDCSVPYCDEGTGAVAIDRKVLGPGTHRALLRNLTGPVDLQLTAATYHLNGSCQTAQPLSFTDGVAVIRGDTRFADSSYGGCTRSYGTGLHYRFSTAGLGNRSVTFEVVSADSTPQLAVDTDCPDTGQAAFCVGSNGYDSIPDLPEGNYLLDVRDAGAFEIRVLLGSPYPRPENDSCMYGQDLTWSGDTFSVSGETRGATEDQPNVCTGTDPTRKVRDVTYDAFVSGRALITATVTPAEATFDPVLSMGSSCTSTVCANAAAPGQPVSLTQKLDTGWRTLVVGGRNGSAGAFTLSGALARPPAEDVCTGAASLQVGQTVSGELAPVFPDGQSWCSVQEAGPDSFFTFTLNSATDVTLQVVPTGFDAKVSLVSGGCSLSTCVATVDAAGVGGTESYAFRAGRAVTYHVGVHSPAGTETGSFQISLSAP